jgi:hypothetical protein
MYLSMSRPVCELKHEGYEGFHNPMYRGMQFPRISRDESFENFLENFENSQEVPKFSNIF